MKAAADPPPPGFVRGTRELRFSLGEFTLGRVRFPAWVARAHVLDPATALATLADFSSVPPDVRVLAIQSLPVAADLPVVTRSNGWLRYVPAHFQHHVIDLAGGFEDYLGRLSRKSRHEMERKSRRFEAHAAGRHELRIFRAPSEMAEFLDRAGTVSRMTYQSRLLRTGLPEGPAFLKELEAAAAHDDVRGYLLTIAGAPVAYGHCRADGDVLVFEHTGYDPALAPHSPGIFLLRDILVRVHAEKRFRMFDFGTGDAQYKRSYATSSRRCATVLSFRRTWTNALLVGSHRTLTRFSDGCVAVLARLGVKDRIKRMLRRG